MNIRESMINLLERCTKALKEGNDLYPDNLTGICAMTLAEELTQEALAITGGKLSKYFTSIIRIDVIHLLGMEFENADDVGGIPDSFYALQIKDDNLAASHILYHCYYLTHHEENNEGADMLCFMIEKHDEIIEFIKKVAEAREVYEKVSDKAWSLFGY